MTETYTIQYSVTNGYVEMEFDSRMPFVLAYQIKEVIDNFYKEN